MNTMNRNKDNSSNLNSVFYAQTYHPIQAGSIDDTDILLHDNAVYRALLCSSVASVCIFLFYDPNVIGEDPYCTVFVCHLSHLTTEDTLRKAMSKYGTVKNLRLVRHIVTGASRGYAFVEYESEREMQRAYEKGHRSVIDDSEILVDYNRQQLMLGWIPRRLGGGLGGKKESGQLRFGGSERHFHAPLRPIPLDDLKRLGIPPPPEGNYMSLSDKESETKPTTQLSAFFLTSSFPLRAVPDSFIFSFSTVVYKRKIFTIMFNKKSDNQKKMEEPHVFGTKSYARLAHEEHLKTLVYPTRGQIYVKAHTRKVGKSVPDKVNKVMASLLSIASDSTQTSSSSTDPTTVDPFDYSNDDYSKVKGPKKEGIYGVLEGCQLQKLHHLLLIQQQWDK
ncbi:hypothetical protein LXL04_000263 [Taraxacum kok-saghyz]